MLNKIVDFLIPTKRNSHHPYALRRAAFASYVTFLLIINSFSVIFLASPKQVVAADINVNRLVELANAERVARGLNTLTVDSRLITAAQNKGADMFAKQYWSHYGPNGETPWQFIKAAGYNYIYAGENLAKDFTSTDPIHTAWMNSPSHRDNIINVNYKDIGIAAISGIFDGKETIIVVQMFGSEYVAPAPAPEPEPEPEPQPEPTTPTPTPEPTPTPTPAPDTTPPAKPIITDPINGALLNSSDFEIKGSAENNSEVEIFDGEERIGTLNADGGAFTYAAMNIEDGEHVLGATATDSAGNLSERSDDVNVTVDTIAPEVNEESLRLLSWDENVGVYEVELEVKESAVAVRLVLGEYTVEMEQLEGDYWSANFAPGSTALEDSDREFSVIATDEAGNETIQKLTLPDLEVDEENLEVLPETGENGGKCFIVDLWDSFVNYLRNASLIKKINLGVGVFLLILAVIDILYLWKKGIKRVGADSLSHLPLLMLLIIGLLFAASGLIL